jgi:hypothetical protein
MDSFPESVIRVTDGHNIAAAAFTGMDALDLHSM